MVLFYIFENKSCIGEKNSSLLLTTVKIYNVENSKSDLKQNNACSDVSLTTVDNGTISKRLFCQKNDTFGSRLEIATGFVRRRVTDHILFPVIVLE